MWQLTSIDFPSWLQEQLEAKNWRIRDLAKHSKLSDAVISRVLSGQRNADTSTLISTASALKISPIVIFRKAGILPEDDGSETKFKDWAFLLQQLTPEDEEELRRLVADSVIKTLQAVSVAKSSLPDPLAEIDDQLTAQHTLRQRVQHGFESQLYSAAEAQARIVTIETEIDKLTRQRARFANSTQNRSHLLELAQQDLTTLHAWIMHDDPATVNHLLTALCQTITITPRYLMEITWR